MKTYIAPKAIVLEFVNESFLAASPVGPTIDIDPDGPGEWEGDAGRMGWNAADWADKD